MGWVRRAPRAWRACKDLGVEVDGYGCAAPALPLGSLAEDLEPQAPPCRAGPRVPLPAPHMALDRGSGPGGCREPCALREASGRARGRGGQRQSREPAVRVPPGQEPPTRMLCLRGTSCPSGSAHAHRTLLPT